MAASMAASSAQEVVSCTVVILSNPGSILQVDSHNFLHLIIPSSSLTICPHTAAQAIDMATLLNTVVSRCPIERDTIPPALFRLLMSPDLHPQVRLRTTRIPIFDARMGNPSYGNIGLGLLSSFLTTLFPDTKKISAIDYLGEWTLPEVVASKNLWVTLGVRLPFHFIVMLSQDNTLPLSPASNSLTSSREVSPDNTFPFSPSLQDWQIDPSDVLASLDFESLLHQAFSGSS